MLTYAVGDVHGCLELLDHLLVSIAEHADGRPSRCVFLGDYIDRGPQSAGVIARLRDLQMRAPDQVICLKGNHEDLMLRSEERVEIFTSWLRNGGDATLSSFGCSDLSDVPPDILAWLGRLPTSWEDERRIYVHAGLKPGRALPDQIDRDRIWIREEFLAGDHDFGKFVVHGHTPYLGGRPESKRHRVNLDTGAVYGGWLTAGIFSDEQEAPLGFLQVSAAP